MLDLNYFNFIRKIKRQSYSKRLSKSFLDFRTRRKGENCKARRQH